MITGTLADRVSALMPQVKTELAELVAMRSVADPRQFPPEVRQFPPEARREAAQWVLDRFAGVRDGRWHGQGAADCEGNILMHLTALRALGDDGPHLKLIVEGAEEQGTGRARGLRGAQRRSAARGRDSVMRHRKLTPMHTPNETVAPSEIRKMALAEAIFLAALGKPS